jgi:hypothetical protein
MEATTAEMQAHHSNAKERKTSVENIQNLLNSHFVSMRIFLNGKMLKCNTIFPVHILLINRKASFDHCFTFYAYLAPILSLFHSIGSNTFHNTQLRIVCDGFA